MPPKRGRAKARYVGLSGGSKRRALEGEDEADAAVSEAFGGVDLPGNRKHTIITTQFTNARTQTNICQINYVKLMIEENFY